MMDSIVTTYFTYATILPFFFIKKEEEIHEKEETFKKRQKGPMLEEKEKRDSNGDWCRSFLKCIPIHNSYYFIISSN